MALAPPNQLWGLGVGGGGQREGCFGCQRPWGDQVVTGLLVSPP